MHHKQVSVTEPETLITTLEGGAGQLVCDDGISPPTVCTDGSADPPNAPCRFTLSSGFGTLPNLCYSGDIDYNTAVVQVIFAAPPANGVEVVVSYQFRIRLTDTNVQIVPNTPTRFGFPQYPEPENILPFQAAGAPWHRGIPTTTTAETVLDSNSMAVLGIGLTTTVYGTAVTPASIDCTTGEIIDLTFNAAVMSGSTMTVRYDSQLGAQLVLQVRDSFGNLVNTANAQVIATQTSGTGTFSGTMIVNTINGVAMFDNVIYDKAPDDVILQFSGPARSRPTSPSPAWVWRTPPHGIPDPAVLVCARRRDHELLRRGGDRQGRQHQQQSGCNRPGHAPDHAMMRAS